MSKLISAVARLLSCITAAVAHPLMPTARLRTVEIRRADTVRNSTRRHDTAIR